jgi:flagellar protein FliL
MNVYKKSILIIAIITLVGIAGFLGWNYLQSKPEEKETKKQETIEELLEKSVDTEVITTNLADEGLAKMKFKIITTSKKNAEELTKLSFLTESTIIKYFNGMTKQEMTGPAAIETIESILKDELNQVLGHEYVTRVYIVEHMVQ